VQTVAAGGHKDQLFADSGGEAENQEQKHLNTGDGSQLLRDVTDLPRIDTRSQSMQQCQRD
jgi:hypothetical protein